MKTKTDVIASSGYLDRPVRHHIPRFFAGVFCTEGNVSGGTGETPDEAVDDYFANYADDEIDFYTDIDEEIGTITVEVFDVYVLEPDDEDNEGNWTWMLGRRVETRKYAWSIEGSDEVPRIVYLLNA